jgi:O-antigen/teichoic acid export membrane protein
MAWLLVMAVAIGATSTLDSEWILVASWAAGAIVGAVLGFTQTQVKLAAIGEAWRSWRLHGWAFGRWLLAEEVTYSAGTQVIVFVVGALLGVASAGGLRAVQAVFGPLTVLGPALALPLLPVLAHRLDASVAAAKRIAVRISLFLGATTVAYLTVLSIAGKGTVLGVAFGNTFEQYASLVLPVAVLQIAEAGSQGPRLLLKAAERGRTILAAQVFAALLSIPLVLIAAATSDLIAVAWSLAISRIATAVLLLSLTIRMRSSPQEAGPAAARISELRVPSQVNTADLSARMRS